MKEASRIAMAAFAAIALAGAAPALAGGSAEDGAKVFKTKCGTCHTVEAGKNRVGPSLHGVVGRPAASLAGFKYSESLRDTKLVWDDRALNAYLEDPKKVAPKGSMAFTGLKKEQEREDVIAYLKSVR